MAPALAVYSLGWPEGEAEHILVVSPVAHAAWVGSRSAAGVYLTAQWDAPDFQNFAGAPWNDRMLADDLDFDERRSAVEAALSESLNQLKCDLDAWLMRRGGGL